jgi:RsiW-degrading membrane proteinase PrsW (M82 family)
VAFVPPLLYLVWIRNTERYSREPFARLLRIFVYGAVLSVILAVILEILLLELFDQNIERFYEILGENPNLSMIILACVIAPFVEELAKALGVVRNRRHITELENGIVFGAAAGLGFAATENLLYETAAYFSDGTEATTSALVGLGIARSVMRKGTWFHYYIGAVFLHGAYNYAASAGVLHADELGDTAYLVGLAAALLIALGCTYMMRAKIRSLDRGGRR